MQEYHIVLKIISDAMKSHPHFDNYLAHTPLENDLPVRATNAVMEMLRENTWKNRGCRGWKTRAIELEDALGTAIKMIENHYDYTINRVKLDELKAKIPPF